ncbi:hypothetical protein [Stackebrandtia nassauensis]|uniref:Membrane protein-like protein n=1 Tax=Stackebrandtia nassauensis (strain DSM 44728 / CIP 108903 / NRRL B-16338 / NBRC 102104 / LLR-40K-21) TaxID=446470 RepID=D3PYL2_STANL|nr:hypothetical protein [Stackebrandtia nassauensis]ADD43445.1 membrane protein-like protein [Stackebrandtia nassauensis DSM 44728]
MNLVLLSIHVVASIVFVGGSAVAASLFPRYAPVLPETDAGERNPATARLLHRITGGYAAVGLIVPIAGIALATLQDRMGEIWITVAMGLTAAAALLLAVQIHPRQREALKTPDDGRQLRTLAMLAGIYNVLWVIVVVLMIVRPGAAPSA